MRQKTIFDDPSSPFIFHTELSNSGGLAREGRTSGALWVSKIWETIHPRNFGYDVSVLRPFVYCLGVMEGNQVSALRGEEYVINRAMYLCNPRFSWWEIAQEMAWPSRRGEKLVYFRNLF